MKSIDKSVLEFYECGGEMNRLREGIGLIEFERTKELLSEYLPNPPAVIYDIGGGYGEYSYWLADKGYEVHLFDLSKRNIEMSVTLKAEYPEVSLAACEVCDARSVPRPDKSADAVLLMGPLYHLLEYEERIRAINESKRLLKDGGLLFSAAITPYSVLLHSITLYRTGDGNKNKRLDDPEFFNMVERELCDGRHINPEKSIVGGLGSSHLHTAKELKAELADCGFRNTRVHGVMGGAWLAQDIETLWRNADTREALMRTVRMLDFHDEIIGLSGHLLAVSFKDL